MRKMVIPYSNFLPGTKILAEHFNTNFDEVEFVFNNLYEDHVAFKALISSDYINSNEINELYYTDSITSSEVDVVLGEFAFTDYETGYALDDEIMDILSDTPHHSILTELLANSIRASFITDEEIENIVRSDV